MSYDRQCSSCGGFCGRGGCKRENVKSEQEPVAWMCPYDPERETAFSWRAGMCESSGCGHQRIPLYTAPPTRKPLNDAELWEMWVESPSDVLRFARAIESAHGIIE